MDYKYLLLDKKDNGVLVLTINKEKSLNALNSEVLKEIKDVMNVIEHDDSIACVVFTGAGKAFIAGADITEMAPLNPTEAYAFAKLGMDVTLDIESLSKPIIAAVNGFALGGGCEFACACDIRIASSKAKFGQPEAGLGITPGFGGTQRLAKIVGPGYAKELIYTGGIIGADEALRIGLVNHVYEPEELMDKALELAGNIAKNAKVAVRYCKSAINNGAHTDINTGLGIERTAFSLCFATADQKEGMKAFVEKRKAEFKGE